LVGSANKRNLLKTATRINLLKRGSNSITQAIGGEERLANLKQPLIGEVTLIEGSSPVVSPYLKTEPKGMIRIE
jgi:hypothetical protein